MNPNDTFVPYKFPEHDHTLYEEMMNERIERSIQDVEVEIISVEIVHETISTISV